MRRLPEAPDPDEDDLPVRRCTTRSPSTTPTRERVPIDDSGSSTPTCAASLSAVGRAGGRDGDGIRAAALSRDRGAHLVLDGESHRRRAVVDRSSRRVHG